MFDPITLALIGGAVGGLMDKKKPLRGAALGAAGGYFAPGLIGGASAAGVGGAGAAGGAGSTGVGSTGAGVGSSGGGLLTMDNAAKGMTMAQQAGLLDQQQQQPAQPGQVGRQGPDFSGLLASQGQLDAQRLAEEEKRKQQQQMIVQGLLGGAYGR